MGLNLLIGPEALIPRKETELLGMTAVTILQARAAQTAKVLRAIDICTGAGNLACGIAAAVPQTRIWASDLSHGAVALARKNVARHRLTRRVTVRQGDLFAPLANLGLEGRVELIVANPPYMSTKKLAERLDLAGEPREAFDGGPYGLEILQRLVRDALPFLSMSGHLLFEFGLGQDRQIRLLLKRIHEYDLDFVADMAGNPRVAVARRRASR
jgi:HemK-like putative methylase